MKMSYWNPLLCIIWLMPGTTLTVLKRCLWKAVLFSCGGCLQAGVALLTVLAVAAEWLQNNLKAQIPPIGVDWFKFLFVTCFACPTHVNKKPGIILSWETPFSQENLLNYFPLPDN